MPKPTVAEMERMAKESRPRSATVRPNSPIVEEIPSSVRLRHRTQPQPEPQTPRATRRTEPKFTIEWDLTEQFQKIIQEMKQHGARYLVGLATGTAVGLVVLGWWLFPAGIETPTLETLIPSDKAVTVYVAADLAAFDPHSPAVLRLANAWPEMDDEACVLASLESDANERIRLHSLAYRLNGVGCPLPPN